MVKKAIYPFFILVCFFGSPLSLASKEAGYGHDYALLLTNYVKVGKKQGITSSLVDYKSFAKDPSYPISIRKLLKTNPNQLSKKEKIAFWINAYNLLTIDLIIKTGETKSIKNQGSLLRNVWKSHSWEIYGKKYSLDQIEHQILRPIGDARIHMAINCASLSCPNLRKEPYNAKKLEVQLQEQVKNFLENPKKGVLMTSSGFKVSKIFSWFVEDFGGKKGVNAFIHSYQTESNHKGVNGYLDYNWVLNSYE